AVIAHELTHFEGGDTAFPWQNLVGFTMMLRLSELLSDKSLHVIDPAVWPLAAFHFYVTVQQARHSREREFRCDARSATHAGPAPPAAALISLHVVNEMPWANMMSVLATAATVGATSPDVFTDQARRAASAHPDTWREHTEDELEKDTKL